MLKRMVIVLLALCVLTTLLTMQQTQQYKLRRKLATPRKEVICHHPDCEGTSQHERRVVKSSFSLLHEVEKYELVVTSNTAIQTPVNSQAQQNRREAKPSSNGYLLPVMFYNMGPNNLFRIFKETISIATMLNRTLVIPPFHHHPRMERKVDESMLEENETMQVDIFDQSYTSIVETDARRILDVDKLQQLLPYATYREFKLKCGDMVTTTLTCGVISGKRELGLKHFQHTTGISLGKTRAIEQISDDDLNSQYSLYFLNEVYSAKYEQCIAIALGNKCFGSRQTWLKYWAPMSRFYEPPVVIKDLSRAFVENIFHGQPFLSVHWRFENIDWLDMCKLTRPQSVRQINKPICEIVEQIVSNRTFLDDIATRIKGYMKKRSLEYLYFAAPPQLSSALMTLQTLLPSMYYSRNVLQFATRWGKWTEVFHDNFSTSYLDQQLCYLSAVFLGSPLSSWTQTVMLDRVSKGLFDHSNIFDVILQDSKRFPKLTWYFPEGI